MTVSTHIAELNDGERSWIGSMIALLEQLQIADDLDAIAAFYESQRAEWQLTAPAERRDPNSLINLIGAGVGDLFVRRLGMRWAAITDEYGTEVGVVGQPGDITLFPMNAVAKRWTGEADGSITDFVRGVGARVLELRGA